MVVKFKISGPLFPPPGIVEADDFKAEVTGDKTLVLTSKRGTATFTLSTEDYNGKPNNKLEVSTYKPDNASNIFKENNTGDNEGELYDHVIRNYVDMNGGRRRRRSLGRSLGRSLRRKVSKKMTRRRRMR
jgi:hypothetical protein